ncbi:hypothetical protein F4678DRAFT_421696 [Xylaria arbuscula]|nr:hypothetical protein F4678DRAFT_421696 [Xylaria arbuscula]
MRWGNPSCTFQAHTTMNSNETDDDYRQQITRRRGACILCREKKVRCNGRRPCSYCEKHEASCSYQPAPRKTPNRGGEDANRQKTTFTLNPELSTGWGKRLRHEDLESTHEPGKIWEGSWPTDPGASEFQNDLNMMDLVFEWSPRHALLTSPVQDPSRPTTSCDNNDLEWLTQHPTTGDLSEKPTLDEGFTELNNNSTVVSPSYLFDLPTQEGSVSGEHLAPESGYPRKTTRRKLATGQSPTGARHQRSRSSLLSTAKLDILSSYNPYVSTLIPGSRKVEGHVGNLKSSIVQRIVTRLLSRDYLVGLPLSWTDGPANESGQEIPNTIGDMSAALMTQMIGLCFDDPWGVTLFLHKSDTYKLVQKHKSDLTASEEDEFDVIDTFLLGILVAWGAAVNANENPALAYALSMRVIDIYHTVLSVPHSISKFLALVCMSQYAFKIGLAQCPAILAQAVSLVQSLNLHLEAGLACLSLAGGNMNQVKRACWVLFCVDKSYAMRWRTFSLLPGIEYNHPPFDSDRHMNQALDDYDNDWLSIWCSYAKICNRISSVYLSTTGREPLDDLQGTAITTTSTTENHEQTIQRLLMDLKTFYASIPSEAQVPSLAKPPTGRLSQRHWTISLAYGYHEAVLAVLGLLDKRPFSPSLRLPCLATSSDTGTQPPAMIVHESSRRVLQLTHHIMDIKDNRTLLHVPTLALCMLTVEHAKNHTTTTISTTSPTTREIQTLFAMAYGLFGRLAAMLPHEDFFDSVTELFAAVADR